MGQVVIVTLKFIFTRVPVARAIRKARDDGVTAVEQDLRLEYGARVIQRHDLVAGTGFSRSGTRLSRTAAARSWRSARAVSAARAGVRRVRRLLAGTTGTRTANRLGATTRDEVHRKRDDAANLIS